MAKKKLQTLKVESVNEGVNAAQVANTEKGSVQNPYTIAELETMLEAGTWQGGYVESVGYNEEENNGVEYGLDGYDGYGYDNTPTIDPRSNGNDCAAFTVHSLLQHFNVPCNLLDIKASMENTYGTDGLDQAQFSSFISSYFDCVPINFKNGTHLSNSYDYVVYYYSGEVVENGGKKEIYHSATVQYIDNENKTMIIKDNQYCDAPRVISFSEISGMYRIIKVKE